jgi:cytochrome c peroxidase
MALAIMNFTIRRWIALAGLTILAALMAIGLQNLQTAPPASLTNQAFTELVNEPIQPIPQTIALDRSKVDLGQKLFRDQRLSADDRISCFSCHNLSKNGADHKAFSIGVHGIVGKINAPTIYNAAFNPDLTWSGKFETIEAFTQAVIQNATAMGIQWQVLIPKLQQVSAYGTAFAQIYPDGVTITNVIDALATYQRSLYTPNSRFDQYLRGNQTALNPKEKAGYQLFKDYGCISCHQGMNVGGNLYQKFGMMGDYFAKRGKVTLADLGRFNVTQNPADRFVFRVPSLRNVALTAPYFHDGSAQTLEDAITVMANYQLGRPLTKENTIAIAQFLQTLTGEHAERLNQGGSK